MSDGTGQDDVRELLLRAGLPLQFGKSADAFDAQRQIEGTVRTHGFVGAQDPAEDATLQRYVKVCSPALASPFSSHRSPPPLAFRFLSLPLRHPCHRPSLAPRSPSFLLFPPFLSLSLSLPPFPFLPFPSSLSLPPFPFLFPFPSLHLPVVSSFLLASFSLFVRDCAIT